MTKEELIQLTESLPVFVMPVSSQLWQNAFKEYNQDMKEFSHPLSMGCKPCYQKVLIHLMKKHL
jgi:hypothetical protein